MPALARTDRNKAHKKSTADQRNREKNPVVTEISVTARIDYIVRFSKQAVLVIADQIDQYSVIAREFLSTLSSEDANQGFNQNTSSSIQYNVAFISASKQLNDIQMRCRLIEQLFGNSLFDPEQSLVDSLPRLARQQGDVVTIVIEHAQALSLQIKYELSQLVLIAKQNKQAVNVVMFASPEAAIEINQHSNIFKNKLTVIDAESGQLYSRKGSKLPVKGEAHWLSFGQKIVLISCFILMGLVTVSVFFYLQTEQGSQYLQSPMATTQVTVIDKNIEQTVSSTISQAAMLPVDSVTPVSASANVQDIHQALTNDKTLMKRERVPAETNDVLSALLSKQATVLSSNVSAIGSAIEGDLRKTLDADYYFRMSRESEGFVVQVAGFSNRKNWQDFLLLYPQQRFFSYQKFLSDSIFTVVTSKAYPDRISAKAAMQQLPKAIKERGLWLKSIATVIAEINTFKE